ncbi:MAG: hypothetical protein ABJ059_18860 [Hyphomicrobiales bacterium]
MYNMHFCFLGMLPSGGGRFFLAISAARQARVGMSGSRTSTVVVLGALGVAELARKNKGLLSASPSRVGDMENPTF